MLRYDPEANSHAHTRHESACSLLDSDKLEACRVMICERGNASLPSSYFRLKYAARTGYRLYGVQNEETQKSHIEIKRVMVFRNFDKSFCN